MIVDTGIGINDCFNLYLDFTMKRQKTIKRIEIKTIIKPKLYLKCSE